MTACRVCNSTKTEIFFSKPDTFFWYGEVSDYFKKYLKPERLDVSLSFCQSCGFIGIVLNDEIRKAVDIFYNSPSSKPGTTHGQKSAYSARLTKDFFSCFERLCGEWVPRKVLEVGCQSGYLLHQFKMRGTTTSVGVEPGDIEPYTGEDDSQVDVRRGYLSRDVVGEKDFDLVFALQVLEHIEDPLEFVGIIADLLAQDGRVIFAVPNEERSLQAGNLGMVLHQHFNYFTLETLSNLLARQGLYTQNVISEREQMLYVVAGRDRKKSAPSSNADIIERTRTLTTLYNEKVNQGLHKIQEIAKQSSGRVGLYGANCSMANIFSWLPALARDGIAILDSDTLKCGKKYSGFPTIIESPDLLDSLNDVIIVPYRLQEEIYNFLINKSCRTTTIHKLYG